MSVLEYISEKNDSRRRSCVSGVKLFLDHVYGMKRKNTGKTSPEEKALYERTARKYLAENHDHVKDLIEWKKTSTMAPKTLRVYVGVVKEFFEVNGIVLSKDQEKKIKRAFSGGEEAPQDAPDHSQIRSYVEHADVRLKAIVYLLSSSGMRIGELLSIKEDQINFDRRMITLKAADTKTNTGRQIFFTREAEKALNAFLKVRSNYIKENNKTVMVMGKATVDDGRIFPYDHTSIVKVWNRNLKKAGQYQRNERGYSLFHAHSLRQFFSTQMRKNGCPDSIVEVLLGHKPYLVTYIRYSPAELQEAYEKYSPCLVIGSADDVRRTVNAVSERLMEHTSTIKRLEEEKAMLEARLKQVETKPDIGAIIAQNPDVLDEYIKNRIDLVLKSQKTIQ